MPIRPLFPFFFALLFTASGLAQQAGRNGNIPPTAVDWPFAAFATTGGSYNPLETTLTTQNVSTLTIKFQYKTNAKVSFAPVIANSVAYYSAGDYTFNAVDATTGTLLWKKKIGAAGPACYSNGVVYVALGLNLYAFDAATGKGIWKTPLTRGMNTAPVLVNGILYFGSPDFNLYAFNAATGVMMWKYRTGNQVFNASVVSNGVVYIGSTDRYFYAVNATTGTLVWKYGLRAFPSAAVVMNGAVYVASSSGVFAIDATAGTLIWQDINNVPTGLSAANGVVYVCDEWMYALDAANGSTIWRNTTSCVANGPAAVANGVLYQSTEQGAITALDASNGTVLWNYPIGGVVGNPISPAVVVNGMVYVSGNQPQTLFGFGLP